MTDEHDTDNDVIMSQEPDDVEEDDWPEEPVAIDDAANDSDIEILPNPAPIGVGDDDAFGDDADAVADEADDEFAEIDDGDGDGWDDDDEDGGGGWDDDVADLNSDQAIMSNAKENASIPTITTSTLSSNCDEINMIPLFAAAPDLKSRSRIGAMVAIRVANLTNITTDQLEVWGLTPEFPFIALKFEFGPFYLNEAKLPHVEVGMVRSVDAEAKLHAFRLSWTIKERINNALLVNAQWPPKGIDMKETPDAGAINDLMESSSREYALCMLALQKAKGDDGQALNLLLDEAQTHKLLQQLPSVQKCRAEFGDILSKISTEKKAARDAKRAKGTKSLMEQYADVDDQVKIRQISEMYALSIEAAMLAFAALGYDEAIDKLCDADLRAQYEAMADVSQTTSPQSTRKKNFLGNFFGGSKRASNDSESKEDAFADESKHNPSLSDFGLTRSASNGRVQSVRSEHFFRSLVMMRRHNFLLRALCNALKVLLNGNKFCMICDRELAFAGLKPTICQQKFCQWRHDQIGLGFSLAAEITNRPDIVDLLISMTYSASNAGRIQFFFPHGVRGLDAETESESFLLGADGSTNPDLSAFDPIKFANGDASQPKPDINKLKEVLDKCPTVEEMQVMAKDGDVALKKALKEVHSLLYPLLVWIITSNRCHIRKLPESDRIGAIETEYQFALCSATPEREAEFQELRRTNGSFLAWHGSAMGNWHSILRMGLRNYSKTKHQTNGAAYGSGIYFARNFQLSWNYCRPGSNPSWKKSRFGAQMSCMALCEICYHEGDAKHHLNQGDVYRSSGTADVSVEKAKTSKTTFGSRVKDKTNRWVKTSGIYVVDQEECVMTRFFFIFPHHTNSYKALEANSLMGALPNVVRAFK